MISKTAGERIVIAGNYYDSMPSTRNWFESKVNDPTEYVHIIYNMSQYIALTKCFCHTSNINNSFISLNKAREYANNHSSTKLLLLKFVELGTYGVYTPDELYNFINNMIKGVSENNQNVGMFDDVSFIDLKCSLTQFLFNDQQQKLIFEYNDKNTIDNLSKCIKNTVGYDISVMEINNKYEVTVQNLNENKLECDNLYKRIMKEVDENVYLNMKKIKNMRDLPDCKNPGLLVIDKDTKPLTLDDIIKYSALHGISSNNINGNTVNGNNNNNVNINININTMPVHQRCKQIALSWIKSNPPHQMEKTTEYYDRYKNANTIRCANTELGKLMRNEAFEIKKTNTGRYWVNK
jgi:hypothetical protein